MLIFAIAISELFSAEWSLLTKSSLSIPLKKIWCLNFRDPGVWVPDFWGAVLRIPFQGVPIFKVPISTLDYALIYLFNRHLIFHGTYHKGLISLYISVLKAKVKKYQDASLFRSNSYEFFLLEYIF